MTPLHRPEITPTLDLSDFITTHRPIVKSTGVTFFAFHASAQSVVEGQMGGVEVDDLGEVDCLEMDLEGGWDRRGKLV